ncbi:MAG: metal-dependent hydrolase [Acidobacteriota bacterium]|nr:metal-dependent hydrolase [Blastocatellia bacterium]MDW8413250.1 metal-dependent hydrolase [Acidobacteriota bacterium]
MDNLTHSLFSSFLYRAYFESRMRTNLSLWIVGANLPDIDIVSLFWSRSAYLEHHRGITHSVVGILLEAPILALAFYLWSRRQKKPLSYTYLLFSSLITLATHPLLDWLNDYGIRPWLPFDNRWYYGDLLFVVDPLIWLLLGAGLYLTSKNSFRTKLFYGFIGTLIWLLVLSAPQPTGLFKLIWTALFLVVVITKRPQPSTTYTVVTGLLLCYLLLLAAMQQKALLLAASTMPSQARFSVSPTVANPFEWRVYAQDSDWFYYGRVNVLRNSTGQTISKIASYIRHPAAVKARMTSEGMVAFDFCRYPIVEIDTTQSRTRVTITDGRYTEPTEKQRKSFSTITVELSEQY